MKLTTLCYIEKDGKYLMLHRIKKENDYNEGKWIGVGGKFEENESPDDCLLREVQEETGLKLTSYKTKGIITFISNVCETEYMYLYLADGFEGTLKECNEGVLKWIPKEELFSLNLWEGDKIFLKYLIENKDFFSLKLVYDSEKLIEAITY